MDTAQGIHSQNMFTYCANNPVINIDENGRFFGIIALCAVVIGIALVAGGCNSNLGPSAPPNSPTNYRQDNSQRQNCYSYAFDLPQAANPGDYSITKEDPSNMSNKPAYTTKEITTFIQRDMKSLNKSVRVASSPSDKKSNEYIVAMKTSTILLNGHADYHFAVQLSDGTWADKPGLTPSRWNKINGNAVTWDLGEGESSVKNYYNTETVFFAVVK